MVDLIPMTFSGKIYLIFKFLFKASKSYELLGHERPSSRWVSVISINYCFFFPNWLNLLERQIFLKLLNYLILIHLRLNCWIILSGFELKFLPIGIELQINSLKKLIILHSIYRYYHLGRFNINEDRLCQLCMIYLRLSEFYVSAALKPVQS